jgi:hypothetical protein
MGTRSTIAIQNADNTVTGIYCHWDGYVEHNGKILNENYTTESKVRELIALGDLSILGKTVGSRQNFDAPVEGTCVAYGRDRNESDVSAATFDSYADLIEQMGQAYDYLFVPSQGWVVKQGLGCVTLREALAAEGVAA